MKRRPGLTLVDLMVSLTILAVIMTVVYAVFWSQQRASEATAQSRDVYAQGMLILDRLSRDISGVWLPSVSRSQNPASLSFDGKTDQLGFITTAVLSLDDALGPDMVEVGYRVVDQDDKTVKQLLRRQDDSLDEDGQTGGSEITLTSDLVKLELIYLDDAGREQSTWNAADAAALPKAVRIKLTLAGPDGREEFFTTEVSPPLAEPAVRAITIPGGLELPF